MSKILKQVQIVINWHIINRLGTNFHSNNNSKHKKISMKKINGYKINMEMELGKGAYGSVYKGEQDSTKTQCAIKIVDKRIVNKDPYLKSALDSQIQIMSKLKSPNIVGFFDVLMSTHNYYIVQELCESDLERHLQSQKDKKVSQSQAITFLTQICNGFLTLVKQGIIHRDLKPANILISKGELKIADFGLAKANIHKKIKNDSCVGTPLYMSLAVLKCEGYTSKCDIWSIGCIFYEMLHGHTPWVGKSQYQLVQCIRSKPLSIDPKLDSKTKDFIIKTLQIKQQDRICWDDVFMHEIFNGYFDHYIDENNKFQNKYKKVMSDLRFKVNSQNIDLEELWSQLNFQQNQDINFQQFQQFLEMINPDTQKSQKIYFFEKLDPEGKGTINLQYFSQELEKHQISTKSKHKALGIKKINTIVQNTFQEAPTIDQPDLHFSEVVSCQKQQFDKKIVNCFQKLHKIITSKGLTLYKTFVVYDKNSDGVLSIDEFAKILKKIDNTLTMQQVKQVFNVIDEKDKQSITFEELNIFYCKINSLPIDMMQSRIQIKQDKENDFD